MTDRAPTRQPRPPTGSWCSHVRTRERATACLLSGGGAGSAPVARARRAALVGVSPCPMEAQCASNTASLRRCTAVLEPCSTCQPRSPTSSRRSRVHTRKRGTARSLSGGGAARAFAARARSAAPVRVDLCPIKAHCASETASLPRGKTVLRRASRGLQRAAGVRVCAHTNAPLCTLCGEEAPRARLRRARAAPR